MILLFSVGPHHSNANPEPDPAFHFNADPDPKPALFNVMGICDHWSIDLVVCSILSLQSAIVSVHDNPRLFFQPLKLFNVDFNADPDPVLTLMRIRFQK